MFTVLVTLQVRPERLAEFEAGILENSRRSREDEPGCLRFDVHRSADDRCRFHLHEVYRDQPAFYVEHRAAAHYHQWKDVVAACVVPGTQQNTYAEPAFPDDLAHHRAGAA